MYSSSNILSKSKDNPIYGKISNRNFIMYYRNVYLQSDHWKNLRREKLELSPVCEKCKTNLSLDVHHISYGNLYDVTIKDLQTLCRKCHDLEHSMRNKKKIKHEIKNFKQRNRKASDLKILPYKKMSSAKRRTNFNDEELFNMLERERIFNTYISIRY